MTKDVSSKSTMTDSEAIAEIEQKETKDRPMLVGERYDAAVLRDFESRARGWLDENTTKFAKMETAAIARGIRGQTFRNWYDMDKEALDALSFEEFMKEFRDTFLPTTWVQDLLTKIYQDTPGKRSAFDWACEAQATNSLLPVTSRIHTDNLRALLQARLDPPLLAAMLR